MTIDLHDLTLPTLPEWGPGVPGTPVEVTYPDGAVELSYAWRDGRANIVSPGRKRRTDSPSWGRVRITAVLTDDPTHWPAVTTDERVQLGEHLVGARVCSKWDGVTVVGPVARVDVDGLLRTEGWQLIASPFDRLRVHPGDLAKAREAAAPKPPTCWGEWESGAVWAWNVLVYRMGDDRVLRLATHGGTWADAAFQPGEAWAAVTLTAPTEEHMARVAAADKAARLPDEPPVGSVVLDRDGDAWQSLDDEWCIADSSDIHLPWAELHRKYGPVTIVHRAAS